MIWRGPARPHASLPAGRVVLRRAALDQGVVLLSGRLLRHSSGFGRGPRRAWRTPVAGLVKDVALWPSEGPLGARGPLPAWHLSVKVDLAPLGMATAPQ